MQKQDVCAGHTDTQYVEAVASFLLHSSMPCNVRNTLTALRLDLQMDCWSSRPDKRGAGGGP